MFTTGVHPCTPHPVYAMFVWVPVNSEHLIIVRLISYENSVGPKFKYANPLRKLGWVIK